MVQISFLFIFFKFQNLDEPVEEIAWFFHSKMNNDIQTFLKLIRDFLESLQRIHVKKYNHAVKEK